MPESNLNVLIAEDDPHDVFLFKRALEEIGYHPVFVQDGVEVTEYLTGVGRFADRTHYPLPNGLILDLKMPRMNGFEVLDWLRQHNTLAIIPTIVFSSSALAEDVQRAYQLGANTYFTKPGSYSELKELLQQIVQYWRKSQIPPVQGT